MSATTLATILGLAPGVWKSARYVGDNLGKWGSIPLTWWLSNREEKALRKEAEKILKDIKEDPEITDEVVQKAENYLKIINGIKGYKQQLKGDDISQGRAWDIYRKQLDEAKADLAYAIKKSNISQKTIDKLPSDLQLLIQQAEVSETVEINKDDISQETLDNLPPEWQEKFKQAKDGETVQLKKSEVSQTAINGLPSEIQSLFDELEKKNKTNTRHLTMYPFVISGECKATMDVIKELTPTYDYFLSELMNNEKQQKTSSDQKPKHAKEKEEKESVKKDTDEDEETVEEDEYDDEMAERVKAALAASLAASSSKKSKSKSRSKKKKSKK